MYKTLRPLLFALDPERSHDLSLRVLRLAQNFPPARAVLRRRYRAPPLPTTVMGIQFPNPIGLAAGLDKNGCCAAGFALLGFGWVEVGTVTPLPQPGNPKKRLFRIAEAGAIINRMGFNNAGAAALVANLRNQRPGIVGINIGKNKDTPLAYAADDYVLAFRAVAGSADYVTVNISSPNTAQLRELQGAQELDGLLGVLKHEQTQWQRQHGRYVPIALKVAPDLTAHAVTGIAQAVRTHRFDGLIATNTTVSRPGVAQWAAANEAGGLSGRPLRPLATDIVRAFFRELRGEVPIIGVGGVDSTSVWASRIDAIGGSSDRTLTVAAFQTIDQSRAKYPCTTRLRNATTGPQSISGYRSFSSSGRRAAASPTTIS